MGTLFAMRGSRTSTGDNHQEGFKLGVGVVVAFLAYVDGKDAIAYEVSPA